MLTQEAISNAKSIIDSRDLDDRLLFLNSLEDGDAGDKAELDTLQTIKDDCSSLPWREGLFLIADHYFVDYSKTFANDLGLVENLEAWPATHINWEAAADDLQNDYIDIDFNGAKYWVRG